MPFAEKKLATIRANSGGGTTTGTAAADLIYGHDGADTLYGRGGNDRMWGGQGADGSVSFRGKLRSRQTADYRKLYHAAEIRSRSAATRWTWMARRRASETVWLM